MDSLEQGEFVLYNEETMTKYAVNPRRLNVEDFPKAFVEAIRKESPSDSSICSREYGDDSCNDGSNVSSSNSSKSSFSKQKGGTLIPESVLAALDSIQRSQLRRVRHETSHNLEGILRNVVTTVDQYYTDNLEHGNGIPAKKMIGEDEDDLAEKRIKAEIKNILRGNDKKTKSKNATSPELQDEEEDDTSTQEKAGPTHVVAKSEAPVCQVMMDIIDDLFHISDLREGKLNEVLQWMEKYPPDSIPGFELSFQEDAEEAVKEEPGNNKLFEDWKVHKNIRRLSVLSGEMGLVKIEEKDDKEGAGKEDGLNEEKRRKILEEKMNKHRAKFISGKVYDVETLSEPKNWINASRAINQVFEDAASFTTNTRTKQIYLNAQKQFYFMATLAENRQEERIKLGLQVDDLTGKLNKERKEAKSLRKKKHGLESQAEKQEDEILELKREMETKDKMITEQSTKIYELEIAREEASSDEEEPTGNVVVSQSAPAPAAPAPAAVSEQPKEAASTSKEKISEPPVRRASKPKPAKPAKPRGAQENQGAKLRGKEGGKKQNQEKEEAAKRSVIMSLKEAKAELEEIKKAGEARECQIKELQMKLETEVVASEQEKAKLQEEILFHKNQTESANRKLELEQEVWERIKGEMTQEKDRLTKEVHTKEEIINYQEQRIQEVAREMTLSLMRAGLQTGSTGRGEATDKLLESKQMLAKLHLKYEYEMQKLREFVENESERHQADMRRMEQEHKRDLHIIYRDTSIIFRAVNRFKECLAALFERENLADAAYGIRNIPNLFDDETVTDPHMRLAKMAGSVTELMVQMEFKMSQGLMNKRMEIKDTSLAKNFLTKDLETREELLKKARELGILQAEKLKQIRQELSCQELEHLKSRQNEEDKHLDMLERNKELTKQNQILNRELTTLQKETQEESTRQESQVQEMQKTNSKLKTTTEQQEAMIENLKAENARIVDSQKMHLKKSDMLRNVKLLNDAVMLKKIPTEKHTVAVAIIEKTMEVSEMRIAHFVRRYVLHKSWKKICEAMREFHKSNKRPAKVEKYLQNMEQRMKEQKKRWEKRKAQLLKTKTELYMHFRNICNKLNKEHGIHLIRPTVRKVQSMSSLQLANDQELSVSKNVQGQLQLEKLKKMSYKQACAFGNITEVKGFQFFVPPSSHQALWEFPPIQTTQSTIVTPKILDMEINKARETCQRVLTSKSCGSFIDKDGSSGFKNMPMHQRLKQRAALFSLPPIASLYPENE